MPCLPPLPASNHTDNDVCIYQSGSALPTHTNSYALLTLSVIMQATIVLFLKGNVPNWSFRLFYNVKLKEVTGCCGCEAGHTKHLRHSNFHLSFPFFSFPFLSSPFLSFSNVTFSSKYTRLHFDSMKQGLLFRDPINSPSGTTLNVIPTICQNIFRTPKQRKRKKERVG